MEGPRAVSVDELPLVEELVNAVFCAPEGRPPALFSMLPRVFAPENTAHVRAVFDCGRPVAVVNYLLDWIVIGGTEILTASLSTVATHPGYRLQGLSSLILDDCLGLMRREGVRLLIVSGDRGLYRRAGCHPAGVVWGTRLGPEDLPPPGPGALRPVEVAEEAPCLWRLHAGEDPRFKRDQEQMRVLLQADAFARAFGYQSRTWLVLQEGQPVAYAIIAVREAERMEGRVLEYAGDRRALAGALRAILGRLGLGTLEISIPHWDHGLLDRLRLAGGQWHAGPMPGTIRLLDPVALWQDLGASLVQRLGAGSARRLAVAAREGGAVSIMLGQEALILQDPERLVGLIFGAGGAPEPTRTLPANLARCLAAILPLPLPWLQGLNYV